MGTVNELQRHEQCHKESVVVIYPLREQHHQILQAFGELCNTDHLTNGWLEKFTFEVIYGFFFGRVANYYGTCAVDMAMEVIGNDLYKRCEFVTKIETILKSVLVPIKIKYFGKGFIKFHLDGYQLVYNIVTDEP